MQLALAGIAYAPPSPTADQLTRVLTLGPSLPCSLDAQFMAGEQPKTCRWTWHAMHMLFDCPVDNTPGVSLVFQCSSVMVVEKTDSMLCDDCELYGGVAGPTTIKALAIYLGHSEEEDKMRVCYHCDKCNQWFKTSIMSSKMDLQNEAAKDDWMLAAHVRQLASAAHIGVASITDLPISILAYHEGLSPVRINKATGQFTCTVVDKKYRTATPQSTKMTYERMAFELCDWNNTRAPDRIDEVEVVETRDGNCTQLLAHHIDEALGYYKSEGSHVAVVLAAPCGSGKTVLALDTLTKLYDNSSPPNVLVIAPRKSLCDTLQTKLQGIATTHHYEQGYNEYHDIAVTTPESLARTVVKDGKPKHYEIVIVDEFCTLLTSIFTQPTYKGPEARRTALRVLLNVLSRAKFTLFLDKDIGLCERMFVSLIVAHRCFGPGRVHHRIWTLRVDRPRKVTYIKLKDEAAALNLAKKKLEEGVNVAMFSPSVKSCMAAVEAINEAELGINAVAIHGTSPLKEVCSRDPDKFCRDYRVNFFAYTSALGVGVSIDGRAQPEVTASQDDDDEVLPAAEPRPEPAFFDVVIVFWKMFLGYQQMHQGMERVRRSGSDTPDRKTIYVVNGHLLTDLLLLRSAPTIADMYSQFSRALAIERKELIDFAFLADDDPVLGCLSIRRCGLSLVAAAVWGRERFAEKMHGTIAEHALFDSGAETVESEIKSTKEERKNLKRLRDGKVERVLEKAAPVQEGDDGITVRRKIGSLAELGIGGDGWVGDALYHNAKFMRLAESGIVSASNLDRLLAFIEGDGRKIDWSRVAKRTENAAMAQLDDYSGPVVGRELRIVGPLFTGVGLSSLAVAFNKDTAITEALAPGVPEMDVVIESLASLKEHNPKRYGGITVRKNQRALSVVRYIANAFFGFKLVGEERKMHGKLDVETLAVLLSLLPKYCAKAGFPRVTEPQIAEAEAMAKVVLAESVDDDGESEDEEPSEEI